MIIQSTNTLRSDIELRYNRLKYVMEFALINRCTLDFFDIYCTWCESSIRFYTLIIFMNRNPLHFILIPVLISFFFPQYNSLSLFLSVKILFTFEKCAICTVILFASFFFFVESKKNHFTFVVVAYSSKLNFVPLVFFFLWRSHNKS